MEAAMRIALLIDADNAPAAKVEVVLSELARHGIANVRRAYGNWKNTNLRAWEDALHPHAIQPIQQFAYSIGKNASDMAMVVDAMDLLHSGSFDAFGIVSSDADFTPLVMRLRGQNMRVFGFGAQHAPKPFVNACSTFLYLDEPEGAANGKVEHAAVGTPKTTMQLRQDTALLSLLRGVAETAKGDDGWSLLGMVGNYIANRGPFDARNYGYPNLSGLIEATEAFEIRRVGKLVYVRAKPTKSAAKQAAKTVVEQPRDQ